MKQIISGKATDAIVYLTDHAETAIDLYAVAQLQRICDNPIHEGCRIRVMPDVHPGKVGTIGLTMTISDCLMPSLTGIDIGCGISVARFACKKLEFQKIDRIIREAVPSGSKTHATPVTESFDEKLKELACSEHIDKYRCLCSFGTLGGGNHFIEIDQGGDDYFLAVHSGSRYLGKTVTEYYLTAGQKELKKQGIMLPYEETWLTGDLLGAYLHDVAIVQQFAAESRECIIDTVLSQMKGKIQDFICCEHNYIDQSEDILSTLGKPLLRKGAISAQKDEPVIIPINMQEGILLGKGLGNPEWNFSAPHGSGRILKRDDVKNHFTVSQFKKAMDGIHSPSIGKDTLDEAPFAYRGLAEIKDAVSDTVSIEKILSPVYSFKDGNTE